MAHIRDRWYVGEGDEKRPTARNGQGRRWALVYRDGDGREHVETFARKPDAQQRLVDVAADVQRGEYVDPRRGRKLFRELLDEWSEGRSVLRSTAQKERYMLAALRARFGGVPIGSIRTSHIRAWHAERLTEVSAITANEDLRLMSAVMQSAVEDELIRRNPCASVRRQPVRRPRFEPWPLETIRALLDWVAANRPGWWPAAALAAGAGLRRGEALAMAVDDVDWLRRTLTVRRQLVEAPDRYVTTPKRGSVGTIPLDARLVDALAAHMAAHPPVEVELPWVERGRRGRRVRLRLLAHGAKGVPSRQGLTVSWRAALAGVGITPAGKSTGLHMLRHCHASYLLAAGEPITVVQARLRHASLTETVGTYAHLVGDGHARVEDPMGVLFGPARTGSRTVCGPSGTVWTAAGRSRDRDSGA